jgi:PleD family two-component response regulator
VTIYALCCCFADKIGLAALLQAENCRRVRRGVDVKILIAEDEFTTRLMVQVSLENWGYRVISVTDGTEALTAMASPDPPQIAILDWEMPSMDGVEVCRRLKETELEEAPYVLMLTARDSKTDVVKGFDAGADDYITKPFNENELRARVRVAERLVRTQRSLTQSVAELKEALNQVEMLEGRIEICGKCNAILNPIDGEWHSVRDVLEKGADARIVAAFCPSCDRRK